MGIEWLAETLGEAKEVQRTEPVRRVGRQTVGHSGILIGTDRCNGPPIVDRHVCGQSFPFAWAEPSEWDVDLWRGDHTHEVSWIDGDLRAARTSMVTMQP